MATISPGITTDNAEEPPSGATPSHIDSHINDEEFSVPIPIQTFLWRQTCPFIRPRLGKLHEATCVVGRDTFLLCFFLLFLFTNI